MSQTLTLPDRDSWVQPVGVQRWCRSVLWSRLQQLELGHLGVVEGSKRQDFGRRQPDSCPQVTLTVADPRFYPAVLFGGTVGAAEAYVKGWWTSSDLTALARLLALNRQVLDGLDSGWSRFTGWLHRLYHWTRRNSLRGSRINIAEHYDLGNDFYSLFLDPSMMYSCAYFPSSESSLEEASFAKNERICRKLQLKTSDHLLEVGTGWGGFAIQAASRFGCRVTTTTISRRQFEYAQRRVHREGLADRIEVLLQDYRELEGSYDKLVSIEMIEAVGHQYFDTYFGCCSRLLKPHGLMLLQAITIADQFYEASKDSVDFIKRYIFPGSCLPSVAVIADCLARVTDFRMLALEDITPHYARTLRAWRERFLANLPEVRRLGFSDEFIRMWNFYFCYCEGGFQARSIGDVQILLGKQP